MIRGIWLSPRRKRGMYTSIVWYPLGFSFANQILASDLLAPLDALSLAVRVALQTTLLPLVTLEDVAPDRTYEERALEMDVQKGRIPHDEKVFQVDDDWVPTFLFLHSLRTTQSHSSPRKIGGNFPS